LTCDTAAPSATFRHLGSDSGVENLRYTVEEVATIYRPTLEQHLGPNPPKRILALDGGVRGILTLGSAQYSGTISKTLFN
jgi:hypothetical protein